MDSESVSNTSDHLPVTVNQQCNVVLHRSFVCDDVCVLTPDQMTCILMGLIHSGDPGDKAQST